jgi:hypothetical protein
MFRTSHAFGSAFIGVFFCSAVASAEFGKPIEFQNLSAGARQAAGRAAPNVQWKVAMQFKEGYKLIGRNDRDRRVTLRLTIDGNVVDVATALPLADVPMHVLEGLKSRMPDVTLKSAETLGNDASTISCYRIDYRCGSATTETPGRPKPTEAAYLSTDGVLLPGEAATVRFLQVNDLPQAALNAARRMLPGIAATWSCAGKDNAGYYMLVGTDSRRRRLQFIWIEHAKNGKGEVGFFRIDVPDNEVPLAARQGLKAQAPGFQPYAWQACGFDGPKATVYHAEAHTVEGKRKAVHVSADGKKVTK